MTKVSPNWRPYLFLEGDICHNVVPRLCPHCSSRAVCSAEQTLGANTASLSSSNGSKPPSPLGWQACWLRTCAGGGQRGAEQTRWKWCARVQGTHKGGRNDKVKKWRSPLHQSNLASHETNTRYGTNMISTLSENTKLQQEEQVLRGASSFPHIWWQHSGLNTETRSNTTEHRLNTVGKTWLNINMHYSQALVEMKACRGV